MRILTIGFTKKPAERFFTLLKTSGAKRVVDVRLNNVSQLAGFAKRDDLAYFLREIGDMDYVHLPELAPTKEILDGYKKKGGDWDTYESQFFDLMRERRIQERISKDLLEDGCLLCSEHEAHHCHRRLVVEYLRGYWGDIQVAHLK